MLTPLIGEVLCQMGVITSEDVERIIAHHRVTRQKFGQIAMRWGLASQEQIWEAWARQLAMRRHFDLDAVGTDTAAWRRVPPDTARRHRVVPVRLWGNHLVVAAPTDVARQDIEALAQASGCRIHVCWTDRSAIERHLAPTAAISAA